MIKENTESILKQLPPGVKLVVAGKEQSVDRIQQAISAGARIIGENYLKEAEAKVKAIQGAVSWHFIGHLQSNKVKAAVRIFDLIETLDSLKLAAILDAECKKINKIMPVLVEVNSAAESQKYGVMPQMVEKFVADLLDFPNLKVVGLMTMGPWLEDCQAIRPYFKQTKELFDKIKTSYEGKLNLQYLSMGMSSSWKVAVEEGANIVRIGTAIFGPRKKLGGV